MIENRPVATVLSHLTLILGVLVVAFPVYITFVASTQTAEQIVQNVPMSLLPGSNMIASYKLALFGGQTEYGSTLPPAGPNCSGWGGRPRWRCSPMPSAADPRRSSRCSTPWRCICRVRPTCRRSMAWTRKNPTIN